LHPTSKPFSTAMSTPPTIDFESLLSPISEEAPSGVSLKEDPAQAPTYYTVKDAREAARAAERALAQAAFADDEDEAQLGFLEKPDWRTVVELAESALRDKSKDLWIASWLLEGLVRLHGFAGLRDGFRLCREISEKFWDGIHPQPDEDGFATTVAQLSGLNGDGGEGALLAPIGAILITQGNSIDPLSGQDYGAAEAIAAIVDPETRAKRVAQGAPTLEMFETVARETSAEFFAELREEIVAAQEEFERLTEVLEEKCGNDESGYSSAPPSSNIKNLLIESLRRVRLLAGDEEGSEESEESQDEGSEGAAEGASGSAGGGSIATREEAFRTLMKIADFFRRTEPHSPISYALEQAVRWGRMPLPELLRDLLPDASSRRELFKLTGLPIESEDD